MNSSVVGQNRLALHTELTDGFQVTSERDRYLNRLKACNSPSKPSAGCSSGSSWGTSRNWRFTGRSSRSGDGLGVVAALAAEGAAGLLRRGERIEAGVGPVVQDRLEGRHDLRRVELLGVVDASLAQDAIESARIEVDLAIVVARADHMVEVPPAVEEAPGHVAHHRAQEGVDRDQVRARLALGRPFDAGEVFVAREGEGTEPEAAVAGDRVGARGLDLVAGEGAGLFGGIEHGHDGSPCCSLAGAYLRQMSDHFSTESGPRIVCCRSTQGRVASKR